MSKKKIKKQKTQQKSNKPNASQLEFEYDDDIRVIPLCSDYHLENIVQLESSPSSDCLIMTPDHAGCGGCFYQWHHLQYLLATEGISIPCDKCGQMIDWSKTIQNADPNARFCHCPRLCINRISKKGKIYAACPVRMGSSKRCQYFDWM
jgi:hypothetical protein